MNFDLKKLYQFQLIITEMQGTIIERKKNGSDQAMTALAIERVDKLIDIYKSFDSFYYNAHFQQQKNQLLHAELQEHREVILELKRENEKLKNELEFQK